MTEMTNLISSDDLAIISTAIAVLQKDSERRRGLVICSDGRARRLSRDQAVDMIDKVGTLAGYERGYLKNLAMEVLTEVRR